MASTARTKEEEKEYFDSHDVLRQKAREIAHCLNQSGKGKHGMAFTGAGISTSAGIPDFRSGLNTTLETGPGKWAIDKAVQHEGVSRDQIKQPKKKNWSTLTAVPTFTHMALKLLLDKGYLKLLVSQNCDGLHRRSGVAKNQMAELHGNTNLERCVECGKEFLRDFYACGPGLSHVTGRKCDVPNCGGALKDSVIHFGESLPVDELEKAESNWRKADFCLALGSSLTVTPAADGPKRVGKKQGANLFIINLQSTPLDNLQSTTRVNGKCDEVMRMVMEEMGFLQKDGFSLVQNYYPFRLQRGIEVVSTYSLSHKGYDEFVKSQKNQQQQKEKQLAQHLKLKSIHIRGIDPTDKESGHAMSHELFKSVLRHLEERQSQAQHCARLVNGHFELHLDEEEQQGAQRQKYSSGLGHLTFQFMGNYDEPQLNLPICTNSNTKVLGTLDRIPQFMNAVPAPVINTKVGEQEEQSTQSWWPLNLLGSNTDESQPQGQEYVKFQQTTRWKVSLDVSQGQEYVQWDVEEPFLDEIQIISPETIKGMDATKYALQYKAPVQPVNVKPNPNEANNSNRNNSSSPTRNNVLVDDNRPMDIETGFHETVDAVNDTAPVKKQTVVKSQFQPMQMQELWDIFADCLRMQNLRKAQQFRNVEQVNILTNLQNMQNKQQQVISTWNNEPNFDYEKYAPFIESAIEKLRGEKSTTYSLCPKDQNAVLAAKYTQDETSNQDSNNKHEGQGSTLKQTMRNFQPGSFWRGEVCDVAECAARRGVSLFPYEPRIYEGFYWEDEFLFGRQINLDISDSNSVENSKMACKSEYKVSVVWIDRTGMDIRMQERK